MEKKRFGIVKEEILSDSGLSLQAKGLYAILTTYADKTGVCWPSIQLLSEKSGVTKRTIHRLLNELITNNHVRRKKRKFYIC